MRPGQVLVLQRAAAMSLARSNSMRRRQTKDPTATRDQRYCTKENCLTCCKKFTAFMFSRVGLFFVMMGYVALGGALFQALEAGNEHDMRRIMDHELNITAYNLWNETLRVNAFPEKDKRGNFSLYATRELERFEATVIRQVEKGFDGRTTNSEHDWNFFGAVLYAVTLVSTIGYGHITTKTTQGKIATILYSAFGVPLMMLFVANIGSTMAKLFAFVFTRLTMIFCCRMTNKKKRAIALKNRQKMMEKNQQSVVAIDEKLPVTTINGQMKSNLKTSKDEIVKESSILKQSDPSIVDPNLRQLPADVRLSMLTGMPSKSTSRSLTSSMNSVGEKSKDAIVRINELIRQNSVQDVDDDIHDELPERRRSIDISPIQYYINETNKLTSNLDEPMEQEKVEQTNLDETNMKQVVIAEEIISDEKTKESKKKSKKDLKRSKSAPAEDRQTTANEKEPSKSIRRRFFSRKNHKLKKESAVKSENNEKLALEQSKSLNQRSLPPPPDYEQSTINDVTPVPTTITWKGEHEFYPITTTLDLANGEFDDEDFEEEDEEMSVPLLVTVFVIPLYLTLGAILFSIWERWSFLNAFYFCFITLTTIGFGDFVPGSSLKVEAEKEKLISAAVYILFGLVLIAMCVNLMKEQLSQKVKRVASKLGSF